MSRKRKSHWQYERTLYAQEVRLVFCSRQKLSTYVPVSNGKEVISTGRTIRFSSQTTS